MTYLQNIDEEWVVLGLDALFRSERPVSRSELRMFVGKLYFTWRRYFQWVFNRSIKYAALINEPSLPYLISTHSTPLYRRLRNVDMWLQQNKVTNLKLAVVKMNGLIIKPGETFSLWRLVGKPTKAKGFKEGMVLTNGSFCPGVGGGLCQLSNLIYWMAIHTPLTVTERWRHTHDVFPDTNRTQPFGSGATVVYNYIDLQIRNDTSQDYQLLLWISDVELNGEWRSEHSRTQNYEVYESNHLISQEWWGGYMRHNEIRRRVFDADNKHIGDDFITDNHAIMMYEPMLPEFKETV
jgi:vancomycin resistance protein VanW